MGYYILTSEALWGDLAITEKCIACTASSSSIPASKAFKIKVLSGVFKMHTCIMDKMKKKVWMRVKIFLKNFLMMVDRIHGLPFL